VDKSESASVVENEDLEDFFENAALSLHWVGPDGTILRANQYELDFLGYDRHEYEGHNIREFHVERDVIEDILTRLVNKETLTDYEAKMRAKDGSIKHVVINSNVRWHGDEFIHTRCFTRDITAMRAAEDQMRQHAFELNDQVIQDVTVAKLALEMKDPEKASHALTRALERAKDIISHLLQSARKIGPGDLVRDEPSGKE
jgi:PAS domain S-box-containing protein